MEAASAAIAHYGTSVSASRIISGQRPVHLELESALVNFLGVEDCLTFVGANSTIVTVVGHLFDRYDLIYTTNWLTIVCTVGQHSLAPKRGHFHTTIGRRWIGCCLSAGIVTIKC